MSSTSQLDDNFLKLRLTTGEQLPDPFGIPESDWSLDLKQWPSLEFPQIHLYLINTPSIYTHINKGAYKSLDAYNYVVCGHVQRVKYHPIKKGSDFCYLKADILPSQRQGQKTNLYKAWVCLHKKDAYVHTAYCTCMAGTGSVCSHAAAILFKIEMAVRNGLTESVACTSKASAWNDMSRRKVDPAPLSEINLSRPKHKAKNAVQNRELKWKSQMKDTIEAISISEILELRDIYPAAAVLTSFDDPSNDTMDTDSASESGEILPQPITALHDPAAQKLCQSDLDEKCCRIFGSLTKIYNQEQLINLESVTREQAASEVWHAHRRGRVTASNVQQICTAVDRNSIHRLNQKLMGYNKAFDTDAMKWGRTHESTAKQEYSEFACANHDSFRLKDSGLVVTHSEPYIGATPDGQISCDCCGKGILEIKCPYKYRSQLVNFEKDADFCLNGEKNLKPAHAYFFQVQLQMFVCKVRYCDFVVWTEKDLVIIRIKRDDQFLRTLIPKVETYFIENLLPEIITRKNDPAMVQTSVCHICSRPKFGKFIFCTKATCQNMFHYECLGIKRSKKGWICPSCQ